MFECCIGAYILQIINAELLHWWGGHYKVDFTVCRDDTVLAVAIESQGYPMQQFARKLEKKVIS